MTTIHMDTDEVRRKRTLMAQHADDMDSIAVRLKSSVSSLSTALQGGDSDQYIQDIHNWLSNFESQTQQLATLSLRVSQEVDEWESMDKSGIFAVNSSNSGQPNDWWSKWASKLAQDYSDNLLSLKDVLDDILKYKSLGNLINNTLEELLQGTFFKETIKDLLKDIPGKALLPFGLELIFERMKGRPWLNAILSSALQLGTMFIPGYGEFLLFSSAVQLGGDAVVGILNAAGDQYHAELIQKGFDTVDLSGYTEKIADSIVDASITYTQHPDQVVKDLQGDGDLAKKDAEDIGKYAKGMLGGELWWTRHLLGI